MNGNRNPEQPDFQLPEGLEGLPTFTITKPEEQPEDPDQDLPVFTVPDNYMPEITREQWWQDTYNSLGDHKQSFFDHQNILNPKRYSSYYNPTIRKSYPIIAEYIHDIYDNPDGSYELERTADGQYKAEDLELVFDYLTLNGIDPAIARRQMNYMAQNNIALRLPNIDFDSFVADWFDNWGDDFSEQLKGTVDVAGFAQAMGMLVSEIGKTTFDNLRIMTASTYMGPKEWEEFRKTIKDKRSNPALEALAQHYGRYFFDPRSKNHRTILATFMKEHPSEFMADVADAIMLSVTAGTWAAKSAGAKAVQVPRLIQRIDPKLLKVGKEAGKFLISPEFIWDTAGDAAGSAITKGLAKRKQNQQYTHDPSARDMRHMSRLEYEHIPAMYLDPSLQQEAADLIADRNSHTFATDEEFTQSLHQSMLGITDELEGMRFMSAAEFEPILTQGVEHFISEKSKHFQQRYNDILGQIPEAFLEPDVQMSRKQISDYNRADDMFFRIIPKGSKGIAQRELNDILISAIKSDLEAEGIPYERTHHTEHGDVQKYPDLNPDFAEGFKRKLKEYGLEEYVESVGPNFQKLNVHGDFLSFSNMRDLIKFHRDVPGWLKEFRKAGFEPEIQVYKGKQIGTDEGPKRTKGHVLQRAVEFDQHEARLPIEAIEKHQTFQYLGDSPNPEQRVGAKYAWSNVPAHPTKLVETLETLIERHKLDNNQSLRAMETMLADIRSALSAGGQVGYSLDALQLRKTQIDEALRGSMDDRETPNIPVNKAILAELSAAAGVDLLDNIALNAAILGVDPLKASQALLDVQKEYAQYIASTQVAPTKAVLDMALSQAIDNPSQFVKAIVTAEKLDPQTMRNVNAMLGPEGEAALKYLVLSDIIDGMTDSKHGGFRDDIKLEDVLSGETTIGSHSPYALNPTSVVSILGPDIFQGLEAIADFQKYRDYVIGMAGESPAANLSLIEQFTKGGEISGGLGRFTVAMGVGAAIWKMDLGQLDTMAQFLSGMAIYNTGSRLIKSILARKSMSRDNYIAALKTPQGAEMLMSIDEIDGILNAQKAAFRLVRSNVADTMREIEREDPSLKKN